MEDLTFLNTLITQLGTQGFFVGIIALYLWKKGIFKTLLNGNGHEIGELRDEMTIMRENHLHELVEKLDKLTELERDGNLLTKEILIILQNERRN